MELTREVEVGEGGRIEVICPELEAGQRVTVSVVSEPPGKKRIFGLHKGKIIIHDNFDDPLEEFEPYS